MLLTDAADKPHKSSKVRMDEITSIMKFLGARVSMMCLDTVVILKGCPLWDLEDERVAGLMFKILSPFKSTTLKFGVFAWFFLFVCLLVFLLVCLPVCILKK